MGSHKTVRVIPSVQSGESWLSRWLTGKKRTEAYLPDDKNKSVSVAEGGSRGHGGRPCGSAAAGRSWSGVAASDSFCQLC